MIRWMVVAGVAVCLAACSTPEEMDQSITDQVGEGLTETGRETLERRVPVNAEAGEVLIESDTYEFAYRWPRQAAAIPALDSALKTMAERTRAEFEASAVEAEADAAQFGYDYRRYASQWTWEVAADTPRFLALTGSRYFYTGGAHGNSTFDAILWDREGDASKGPLEPLAVFSDVPALYAAASKPYCIALGKVRIERISEAGLGDAIEDICPELSELTISLGTSNGRTIDRLVMIAAPYVVGPYAEGSYSIEVPMNAEMLALVKPRYRAGFSLAD
ncbi:DUF4163 domain-containing protein [Erythrobacter sp. KY5]|uniref:DUF4163 domain-containing protein n=1 Tax=Erythrobacter sp. KY5 TaxID=2011159 RepID=UPI0013A6AA29|nr:DUF4163 domain-containing protein [Erythrobacter sp. KY5]